MTAIAHYGRRAFVELPLVLAAIVALNWFAWRVPDFKIFLLSGGFIILVLCAATYVLVWRQILFRRRVAVWVEDGKLAFIGSRNGFFITRLPLHDIESFAIGPLRNFRHGIDVRLRGGSVKSIGLDMLAEPRAMILERLQALLPA